MDLKNIKKDHRQFIINACNKINNYNIDNDLDEKICIELYKIYLEIYDELELIDNININDINNILINFNKNDEYIDKFKKFIKIKNIYIIKKIIKSKLWNDFINKTILKLNSNIDFNNSDNKYIIEKGIYHILIKTCNLFQGCWEIATFKNDKIIKLELIDPDEILFLINYINNKIKI